MDKIKAMNLSLDEYIETAGIDEQCNEPMEQESENRKILKLDNLNALHMSLDEYIKTAGVDKKYRAMKERNSKNKNFHNNHIFKRNHNKTNYHHLDNLMKSIVRNGANIQKGAFRRRLEQFGRGNALFPIEMISPELYVRYQPGMFKKKNQSLANVLKSFDKKGANIQNGAIKQTVAKFQSDAFGRRVGQSFGIGNSSFPSEIISPELSVRNQKNNQGPANVLKSFDKKGANIQNGAINQNGTKIKYYAFGRRVGQPFAIGNSSFPSEIISPELSVRNQYDIFKKNNQGPANVLKLFDKKGANIQNGAIKQTVANIQNDAFGRRVDQSFARRNSSFPSEIISPELSARNQYDIFKKNNQSHANVLKSFDKKGANIQNGAIIQNGAFGQRVEQSFGRGNSSFSSEIISPVLSVGNQSDMLNKYNKTNDQTPAYVSQLSNIQNGPFGRRVGQSFIRRNSPFPSELISPELYARNMTDVFNRENEPNANKFEASFLDFSENHEKLVHKPKYNLDHQESIALMQNKLMQSSNAGFLIPTEGQGINCNITPVESETTPLAFRHY